MNSNGKQPPLYIFDEAGDPRLMSEQHRKAHLKMLKDTALPPNQRFVWDINPNLRRVRQLRIGLRKLRNKRKGNPSYQIKMDHRILRGILMGSRIKGYKKRIHDTDPD